jgi:spore coat polysaccharide biosynthesis protein SpsF
MVQPVDQSAMRWTVDRCDDFAFVRGVYEALHAANPEFSARDVHELLAARPDLAAHGGMPVAAAA